MADSAGNAIVGTIVAAGVAALGWMGKQLYSAPRPAEYQRLVTENAELKAAVAEHAAEAKRLFDEREIELRELRSELAAIRTDLSRAEDRIRRGADRRGRQVGVARGIDD